MRVVLMLALLSVPSVVHANQLRVTSYDMDEAGGAVHLVSDAPIGETWLRVEGRSIRIWFPNIADIARFDHQREPGDAIRSLMLRPGASETAVLKIEIGVPERITPHDVEIARTGTEAVVRIRVPGLVSEMDAPVDAAPVAVQGKNAVTQRTAAVSAQSHAGAKPDPEPQPMAAESEAPLGTAKDTNDVRPIKAAGADPEFLEDSKPTLTYLMLACVVLGVALAVLQVINRRRPKQHKPEIEVLGARRLGHRQELVIVRALGSDHLLLCTAGRAERVASTPSPTTPPLDPRNDPDSSQAGGIGLISRLSSHHRLRKLLDNVERESAAQPESDDAEESLQNNFGAELMSANRRQRALPAPAASRGRPPRQSEAVAGISRLRKRAAG